MPELILTALPAAHMTLITKLQNVIKINKGKVTLCQPKYYNDKVAKLFFNQLPLCIMMGKTSS